MLGSICSGCGICAAVCPEKCIKMVENRFGELVPAVDENVCLNCGLCRAVCPFSKDDLTDSELRDDYGYYVGRIKSLGRTVSSGGFCTEFLKSLFESGEIDAVACAVKAESGYRYGIVDSVAQLEKCGGLAYCPLSVNEAVSVMKNDGRRYAVVGVPCVLRAFDKACEKIPALRKNITVKCGLVCGGVPSYALIDCVASSFSIKHSDIADCIFKIHAPDRPADDYGMRIYRKDGSYIDSYGSEEFGYLFWHHYFSVNSCMHCRDIFCDSSDVTFMDAWLDEYKKLNVGTSFAIVKSQEYRAFFDSLVIANCATVKNKSDAVLSQKKLIDYKLGDKESNAFVRKVTEKYRYSGSFNERLHEEIYLEKIKKNKVKRLIQRLKNTVRHFVKG